jgi:hypothetical protein
MCSWGIGDDQTDLIEHLSAWFGAAAEGAGDVHGRHG